jgi:manganese/zinc/iron transport system permease protein
MLTSDAVLIAMAAGIVALMCALLFKEFALLCFDTGYARSQGWPVVVLDIVMMSMVVAVTVIGLQAVGVILIIALLVIPPAAARFWTDRLSHMVLVAGIVGGVSGLVGAGLSALVPRLPAGAVIVVVAGSVFGASMILGPTRGLLVRWIGHVRLNSKVARQHLLRAMYESCEWSQRKTDDERELAETAVTQNRVSFDDLLSKRSWSPRQLRRTLNMARRNGLIIVTNGEHWSFTPAGAGEACRVVRNHRLWELFLITHADIAASHVDRDADQIEHVLGHEMVENLEALLGDQQHARAVPVSPHLLEITEGA